MNLIPHHDFQADRDTLLWLYGDARTRLLDGVDLQRDFMLQAGALGIHPANGSREDASAIIPKVDKFLAAVPDQAFDLALFKFDTHFPGEYPFSPESQLFPDIHCQYGQPGWQLAVDIAPIVARFPTWLLAKNEFDMWGSNPVGLPKAQIVFSPGEAAAYDNLFKIIPLMPGDAPADRLREATDGITRDAFMAAKVGADNFSGTVVTLIGVASDFCDHQAMLGYLARGAIVVVAEDLTAGIGGLGSPVPETGQMQDVVATVLADNPGYVGRLFTAQSGDILAALNALATAPNLGRPAAPQLKANRYER